MQIRAGESYKENFKIPMEREQAEQLKKVFMSGLKYYYSIPIKTKKSKKVIRRKKCSYTPKIYKIFKVLNKDYPKYDRIIYTLNKLDVTPLYTQSKTI